MKLIDKLAWVFVQDKRILLARSKGKVLFYLPGGKRETGETDIEALCREIKEELSVHLNERSMEFMGEYLAQADEKRVGTNVKIRCYTAHYIGTMSPDSEIDEIKWLKYSDIDQVSEVTKVVMRQLKYKLALLD